MKKRLPLLLLPLLLLLCGCADAATKADVQALTDEVRSLRQQLSDVQQRLEALPTPSPVPTAAPAPTPLPVSYKITTGEIVEALKATGFPIGRYETYTEDTDPNDLIGRPRSYTDKTNFWDERVGTKAHDDAGMLEIFESAADAESRKLYVENLYAAGIGQLQYCLRYDNILLRFESDFKPADVEAYDAAMKELLGQ